MLRHSTSNETKSTRSEKATKLPATSKPSVAAGVSGKPVPTKLAHAQKAAAKTKRVLVAQAELHPDVANPNGNHSLPPSVSISKTNSTKDLQLLNKRTAGRLLKGTNNNIFPHTARKSIFSDKKKLQQLQQQQQNDNNSNLTVAAIPGNNSCDSDLLYLPSTTEENSIALAQRIAVVAEYQTRGPKHHNKFKARQSQSPTARKQAASSTSQDSKAPTSDQQESGSLDAQAQAHLLQSLRSQLHQFVATPDQSNRQFKSQLIKLGPKEQEESSSAAMPKMISNNDNKQLAQKAYLPAIEKQSRNVGKRVDLAKMAATSLRKGGNSLSHMDEDSSKFSLFEEDSKEDLQKFEFEKQMLLQLELRESLAMPPTVGGDGGGAQGQNTFAGFNEAVLAEEMPGMHCAIPSAKATHRSSRRQQTGKAPKEKHSVLGVIPNLSSSSQAAKVPPVVTGNEQSKKPSRNPKLEAPYVVAAAGFEKKTMASDSQYMAGTNTIGISKGSRTTMQSSRGGHLPGDFSNKGGVLQSGGLHQFTGSCEDLQSSNHHQQQD